MGCVVANAVGVKEEDEDVCVVTSLCMEVLLPSNRTSCRYPTDPVHIDPFIISQKLAVLDFKCVLGLAVELMLSHPLNQARWMSSSLHVISLFHRLSLFQLSYIFSTYDWITTFDHGGDAIILSVLSFSGLSSPMHAVGRC